MDSGDQDESVFREYKELAPKTTSKEQYTIALIHIIAAISISIMQFSEGLSAWFVGFGIITPILLIVQGFFYVYIKNHQWYRDQMVPFISKIVMVTEIEADQFVRHHRRLGWYSLVIGWIAIITCQMIWTWGFSVVMPLFFGDDLITRFVGELIGYAVLFGPFFLYLVLLYFIYGLIEQKLQSRNEEIRHIFDIASKWAEENQRRSKPPESYKENKNASESWNY
ncbi:MAG: hypothetical protein ACW974_13555 [Candidatus Thorarchaeota archaeon]|jgi:hypothetical protein